MKDKIIHVKKLNNKETIEIKQLVAYYKTAKQQEFKIDNDAFTSNQVEHLLYYSAEKLIAYMIVSCYGNEEIEVTTVMPEEREIFTRLHEKVVLVAKEKNIEKILYINEHEIEFFTNELIKICGKPAFCEYRMSLCLEQFVPQIAERLTIQPAVEDEMEQLMQLDNEAFGIMHEVLEITEETREDIASTIVAYTGDVFVGKMRVHESNHESGIYGFVIDSKQRGKGYGREMMTHIISELLENGTTYVFLEVNSANEKALPLYQSIGFQTFAVFDYYMYGIK